MALDIKTELREKFSNGPFCVATDGSNEQCDKQYPVVITTVGERNGDKSAICPCTWFAVSIHRLVVCLWFVSATAW